MSSPDLVVVGGGTGGCLAAIAGVRAGLHVVLLERHIASRAGTKACGDAMEAKEVRWMREVAGIDPGSAIIRDDLGARIESSDGRRALQLGGRWGRWIVVDRPALGRLLQERAASEGVLIRHGLAASGLRVDAGVVTGVEIEGRGVLDSRVVIDATGAAGSLRRAAARAGLGVEPDEGPRRRAFAHRRVGALREGPPHPDAIVLRYDLDVSGGGYSWVFPAGDGRANVGLGGMAARADWAERLRREEVRLEAPRDQTDSTAREAGAFLPMRGMALPAVGAGYMTCGDAAFCVGPLDGAGIHASMVSGWLAAQVAAAALSRSGGTPGRSELWPWHRAWLRYSWPEGGIFDQGALQASQEGLRPLLQSMNQKDLDFLVGLASPRAVAALYHPSVRNLAGLFGALGRGMRRPRLMIRLARALVATEVLRRHWLDFPEDPSGFASWKSVLDHHLVRLRVI